MLWPGCYVRNYMRLTEESDDVYMKRKDERSREPKSECRLRASCLLFVFPILAQLAQVVWTHTANILDFNIHLNGINLAKSNARIWVDDDGGIDRVNHDRLLVHAAFKFAWHITVRRIGSTKVNDCMFYWVAARFQGSTVRICADATGTKLASNCDSYRHCSNDSS